MVPAVLSAATFEAADPADEAVFANFTLAPDPDIEYIETNDPLTATFLRSPLAIPSKTSLHSLTIGHF